MEDAKQPASTSTSITARVGCVGTTRSGRMPKLSEKMKEYAGRKPELTEKSSSKYWMDGKSLGIIDLILRKIDLLLYRILHRVVDGIECITKEYKEFHIIKGVNKNHLTVVGNAFSEKRFHYEDNKTKNNEFYPTLGYCGSKPSERGAREILYLIHKLKHRFPKIRGVIVGWDQEMDQIKEEAKKYGISDRLESIGQQPFSEVPEYLNKIDIGYSFTSELDIVGGDSSMKLRQYLECGIPVITFPMSNGFIDERNLGITVELGNMEALNTATLKILKDLEKSNTTFDRKNISQYAINNFSHKQILKQRIEFWNHILEQ